MDQHINEALADVSEEEERPRKKQKYNNHKKIGETLPPITKDDFEIARKELKMIMLKNPNIDIEHVMRIHNEIMGLDQEELTTFLENAKIEIGLKNPNQNSHNIIALISLGLQRLTGNSSFYKRMMNDSTLIASLEHYFPDPSSYLSVPFQIVARVAGHLSDVTFNQNNFSPDLNEVK